MKIIPLSLKLASDLPFSGVLSVRERVRGVVVKSVSVVSFWKIPR